MKYLLLVMALVAGCPFVEIKIGNNEPRPAEPQKALVKKSQREIDNENFDWDTYNKEMDKYRQWNKDHPGKGSYNPLPHPLKPDDYPIIPAGD